MKTMKHDPILLKEWNRLVEVILEELDVTQTLASYQRGVFIYL